MIDELRRTDDEGIELRLLMGAAAEREEMVYLEKATSLWDYVANLLLPRIARGLRHTAAITGIVHGGEDIYTFIFDDGAAVELSIEPTCEIARIMQEVASLAASLVDRDRNLNVTVRCSPRARLSPPLVNRIPSSRQGLPYRRQAKCLSDIVLLPGQLNPRPSIRELPRIIIKPNRLRRAS